MKTQRRPVLVPDPACFRVEVPDDTPAIVARYAMSEKQLLLAKVRHNRLIDRFFNCIATSIQSNPRTKLCGLGIIETDEIYIVDPPRGQQSVVAVRAKVGKDKIGSAHLDQDLALCRKHFPSLVPRLVSVQFVPGVFDERIALIEVEVTDEKILHVDEKHYRLVPASQITAEDLSIYRQDGASNPSS